MAGQDHPPLAEPIQLVIEFRMPTVASDPFRTRHVSAPDLSKLVRATEDALVDGGILADDRWIYSESTSKLYHDDCPPGALIRVIPMGDAEEADRLWLKGKAAGERRRQRRAS